MICSSKPIKVKLGRTIMRFAKLSVVMLCVVSVSTGALAQGSITLSGADPVLRHIPAGALGFIVVNNVKSAAAKVDAYLSAIGLGEMVQGPMPNGLLEMIKVQAKLGEGFDANGGFAAVMLDPQQFGFDILQAMGAETRPAGGAAMPSPPFVFLIPGSSVQAVFANYEMEPAGKLTKIKLRMGGSYAAKVGGYVAVGLSKEAVLAVTAPGKKAAGELNAAQAAAIAKADITLHLNMKVAGPILDRIIRKGEEEIAKTRKMMTELEGGAPSSSTMLAMSMADILPFYRNMLSQLQAVTVTGRFTESALLLDELVVFAPDSTIGAALAAFKAPTGGLLDRLPNLSYVLAVGAANAPAGEELAEMQTKMLDSLLESPLFEKVPAETRAKIKSLSKSSNEQVNSVQYVVGGAPQGKGLFGLACVVNCKDAETFKGLLAESAATIETVIKALVDDEEVEGLKITHNKAVEKVGGLSIDAIEITHPKLTEMDEDERAKMIKVLGEGRIRLLVASPDRKTVVVTFGGSGAFMAEALKTAKGGGTIPADPEVVEAMKHMPKNRAMVLLFNGGNLCDLIVRGIKTMKPGSEDDIPFRFTTRKPIAIGAGIEGSTGCVTVYVPNEFVKEVVGVVMGFFSSRAGPRGERQPPEGSEDF